MEKKETKCSQKRKESAAALHGGALQWSNRPESAQAYSRLSAIALKKERRSAGDNLEQPSYTADTALQRWKRGATPLPGEAVLYSGPSAAALEERAP